MSNLNRYLPWAILLVLGVLACFAFRDANRDLASMRATIDAQKKVIEESQRVMADNHQKLKDSLAEIARQRHQVKTPEQAARAIPQVIPGVETVIVHVPQASPPDPPVGGPQDSPTPPAPAEPTHVEMPLQQLKTLYDFAQDCQACKFKLDAAEVDKAELLKQLAAVETQKTAAVNAARGGSFVVRLKRESKHALGAAGGAGVGAAICSKSKGPVIAGCAGVGALTGFLISHF